LSELAARLGSDVPFFLFGGTCLAEGRGEQLTQLPDPPLALVVLHKPPVMVPTSAVYAALTSADFGDGGRTYALTEALKANRPLAPDLFCNSLEGPARRLFPEIAEAIARFQAAGANWVCISGSGPTLFTLPESYRDARRTWGNLRRDGEKAFLLPTRPAEP